MFTIAFYVHHHGSGHLMRTLQVAAALTDYRVILIGSAVNQVDLSRLRNVEIVQLPPDTGKDHVAISHDDCIPDTFHYAPLDVPKIKNRMAILSALFEKESPMILVVDVSVEITLFARLCGIPTVVICQHGKRDDLPHLMAYQSAALLIAPFSESLYIGDRNWVYDKTVFTGGFSRFRLNTRAVENTRNIAILIGAGGTSITKSLVEHIARQSPTFSFHVLGEEMPGSKARNIIWHGTVANPEQLLKSAAIIIGNTGHNTVMEVASLNKRFIGIPEERPFEEQVQKAQSVAGRAGICIVQKEDLWNSDWTKMLDNLSCKIPDWEGVIIPDAINKMANAIIEAGKSFFEP